MLLLSLASGKINLHFWVTVSTYRGTNSNSTRPGGATLRRSSYLKK